MAQLRHLALGAALTLALAGCETNQKNFPQFEFTGKTPVGIEKVAGGIAKGVDSVVEGVGRLFEDEPPQIRQPVLPEMLVACRGHVIVPALGMRFVERGKEPPKEGQYMREERLTPPYRVIPFGAPVSREQSTQRLSVELDKPGRIISLYCG